jgi:hypothetical protein
MRLVFATPDSDTSELLDRLLILGKVLRLLQTAKKLTQPCTSSRTLPRAQLGSGHLESCFVLALRDLDKTRFNYSAEMEPSLENMCCLRCNRQIEPGGKSIALYMFAQTVGIRPRQKSGAHRVSFCPQCSVSLAMGPPPEGALNVAAWEMIRHLVGSDPALTEAAWESLSGVQGLLPTGTEGRLPSSQPGYFEF